MYYRIGIIILLGVFSMPIFGSMPELGEPAPKFNLEDQDGVIRNLKDYKNKKLVIYFFPKADTPGWKKQACGLRDNYSNYEKSNIEILGISYDSKSSLKNFKEKYDIQFNFLSDLEKNVGKAYGVNRYFFTSRKTFLINEEGILIYTIDSVDINTHASDILVLFDKLKNWGILCLSLLNIVPFEIISLRLPVWKAI